MEAFYLGMQGSVADEALRFTVSRTTKGNRPGRLNKRSLQTSDASLK